LFLLIGIMLYSFHASHPQMNLPLLNGKIDNDKIFPTFVVTYLPHGIRGIMVASMLAAAMSTLSSSLNALASTTVVDFYQPFLKKSVGAAQQLSVSRWITVFWGAVLTTLAILSSGVHSVLEAGLTIASITYGSMLGVFLLGVLTKRANEKGSILGMVAGFISMLAVWHFKVAAWTWYVLIGTGITFATGYVASLYFGSQPAVNRKQ
jgi:solute:Na+ symporter, SSS family